MNLHLLARLGGKDTLQFLSRVLRRSSRDRVMINASSLAFHWFITIIPGSIALVGVANLIGLSAARLRSLTHGISVLLPASAAKIFEQALTTKPSHSSAVLAVTIAGLVAFWASIESTATLQIALDMAYETSADRGFIERRLRGLLLVGITLIFGGAGFALLVVGAPLGTLIQPTGHSSWFPILWDVLRWVVGITCIAALLSCYDYFGPNRSDKAWRILSIGGAVSTVLWLAAASCYSYYLNHFGHTSQTYGAFAGVVALLLWLFLTAAIILFGAEFNRELERGRTSNDHR